ncbi:MAG: hypothetical protein GYB53_05040 [Rhodobacteraceae bacterium]|nr:hypothetical protein [Paracoccaceae bacterium]MBR9822772.1 hypothetical protein [Paracoccaceae bacterium]
MRPIRTAPKFASRPASGLALGLALLAAPLPLAAQDVVENEVAKIFAEHWMQSKEADKNGLLMYLSEERAMQGDYFSIRCEGDDRSIRLGFGDALEGDRTVFRVDGRAMTFPLEPTGVTPDPAISQGDIHGYRMVFSGGDQLEAFLGDLRRGSELVIEGQDLPISLSGSAQALQEQAAYCQ